MQRAGQQRHSGQALSLQGSASLEASRRRYGMDADGGGVAEGAAERGARAKINELLWGLFMSGELSY